MTHLAPWSPLTATSRSVALEVLRHGPLSRSELARRLDLSAGTLTRLAKPLLDAGLLAEGDYPHETSTGRPGRPLDVVAGAHHFAGVELTGTEATAVLTDLRAGTVATASAALPDPAPGAVVEVVAGLVARLAPSAPPVTRLGVALGGQVEATSTVLRAPFLGWDRVPLAALLEEATGIPSCVENDVVSLTTAEHWFGAGAGRDDLAVVTVGAGVGCGLVVHGEVVNGTDAGVGLLGHAPLGLPGPLCFLGHRGCAVAVLTDGSVLAQASVALGRPVAAQELRRLAAEGDQPAVRRLLEDVAVGVGRLVALVANVSTVPCVIVSGEGVDLVELAADRVREEVAALRDPAARPLEVLFRHCPPEVWARGAAAVAIQQYVSGEG